MCKQALTGLLVGLCAVFATKCSGLLGTNLCRRYEMLKGTKWVDEIIGDPYAKNEKGEPAPWGAPYSPHPEWLDRLFTE